MKTLAKQIRFSSIVRSGLLVCVIWISAFDAEAQHAVYKCGQEITNQPQDAQRCERLSISQPTQIEGTRVQNSVPSELTRASIGKAESANTLRPQDSTLQASVVQDPNIRNVQARTILEDEWQKLNAKYAELVQLYNKGQPALLAGEAMHQANYQERVQALKVQLQRTERDMQALQRELGRHGKQARAGQNN
ncbi:MAG: hypothetical protein RL650_1902 [Pseudomonadota bacterium]